MNCIVPFAPRKCDTNPHVTLQSQTRKALLPLSWAEKITEFLQEFQSLKRENPFCHFSHMHGLEAILFMFQSLKRENPFCHYYQPIQNAYDLLKGFQSLKRENPFCHLTRFHSSTHHAQCFNRSNAKTPFATLRRGRYMPNSIQFQSLKRENPFCHSSKAKNLNDTRASFNRSNAKTPFATSPRRKRRRAR